MTLPLRPRAEALAAPLPPLLADASKLARGVMLGEHGRKRPGMGDAFWQYRTAQPGDPARSIDWRRSARSDVHFVAEKEWQAAQSVVFWVDRGQSMQFTSDKNTPTKSDRAALLSLATAVLLVQAGERVGLTDMGMRPMRGEVQLGRVAERLMDRAEADYAVPDLSILPRHSRAVFVSDFMADPAPIEAALATAADRGVTGVLLQILDPSEEAFPFDGRTVFHSVGNSLEFETRKAGELRDRYLDRLARRKERLGAMADLTGWRFHTHHTNDSPSSALLWIYAALEGRA
ncbi:DUF58 domain-containing protein [Maritimibacter sp. UBA3975]|uniref:DUF58 domain-containing protein n=1 Tax=Maritimibacter sp. UBA3975 TaxID=1946833 RepID=UPI000C099E31|nr:DUF58 domain-containing protein [Maritimibacter sp. UBA3975]MAM63941.1 DUF58 domain-containing protein [Maritimibacter sp.]